MKFSIYDKINRILPERNIIMKIAAVIAEYNPFHNGHLYQLHTIREALGADRIIVIMSGNFTQRGAPALVDKFDRCSMALENGADVVFELPVYYATGSAEFFAQGAVSLLDKLGVVDILHFGSEGGSLDRLTACAKLLANEPASFKASLNHGLKEGLSFPAAQAKALCEALPHDDLSQLLALPNNTLGIEYIKALLQRKSTITPATLQRRGNQYHDLTLRDEQFASANAIRSLLLSLAEKKNNDFSVVKNQLPPSVFQYFAEKKQPEFLFSDDFSIVMYYRLLADLHDGRDFTMYYDVTKQLSDVILKKLPSFTSLSGFCLACKSKNLTYNRISRCLMHILLNLTQEQLLACKANDYASYARLLGFTEGGKDVLKAVKANASIPVITKLPKALKELDNASALSSLKADIYASRLYHMIQGQKYGHTAKNEFTREIIRI